MIDALLEAFPGSELLTVDEDVFADTMCTWGGCGCEEPLVLISGRDDPWCLTHALDDALPDVFSTHDGLGPCIQCGRGTAQVLEDGTRIHENCRRDFKARRASGAKPKGAYARRKARPASASTTTG